MMLKKIALLLSFTVSGCMLAPVEQEPRWTDDVLAELPEAEAPDYIPTVRLTRSDRRDLVENENDVRARGEAVRRDGEALRAQTPDTEEFAAEQRARAQGPD